MDGQMTIFDLLPKKGFCENQTVNELTEELKQVFPDITFKSYHVWSHVPNLGKRLWADIEHYPMDMDIEWLQEKYLKKSLEITISVVPNFDEDNAFSAYLSTMWKTKGHKEI